MTDRQDDDSDRFADEPWMDDADGDGGERDFAPEDFDADMIAAARMMPEPTADGDADAAGDDGALGWAEASETENGPPAGRRACAELGVSERRALQAELARHFGPRRAEAAARTFARDLGRAERSGARGRQAAIRSAARRLALRHPAMDEDDADRLAVRLMRVLAPAAAPEARAADGSVEAELRAATQALRQAAECLVRMERWLVEHDGARG
jgi:hypothetical protein